MGGGVISFGLCVVLVCISGSRNEVKADPIPAPAHYDICTYIRAHAKHSTTTTAAPAEDKPKDEKKGKIEQFHNLLRDLLEIEKESDKNKEEETKKKEEEEKKKKEEDAKRESKKDEPKGFQTMNDFWDSYIKFLTSLYYSF